MNVDVYSQFFLADCDFDGVKRRAALVSLTSDSCDGKITYTASATFFPHTDDEDFAVSYDAYVSKILYEGKGRRSKKRESELIEKIKETVDSISDEIGGKVRWESPLMEARLG